MNANEIARAVIALRARGYAITEPNHRKPQPAPGDDEPSRHALAAASPDWSPEDVETLRTLWPDLTVPSLEICARLGRSMPAIKKKARLIGVMRRPVRPKAIEAKKPAPIRLDFGFDARAVRSTEEDDMLFWNDDRDAELRRLAKIGCGDPEIAAVLGCTKNAVIGRRHRLHIELTQCQPGKRRPLMVTAGPHKAPKTPKKPKEAPKLQPAPFLAPEVVPMPQPALEPVEMLFAPIPKVDAPPGAAAAILALKPGMCKWPIGDARDDDFHFCGCKALLGRSYCSEHHRASFGIGTLAKRKAVTAAPKELA